MASWSKQRRIDELNHGTLTQSARLVSTMHTSSGSWRTRSGRMRTTVSKTVPVSYSYRRRYWSTTYIFQYIESVLNWLNWKGAAYE